MRDINIYFCDFWKGFDVYDNIFTNTLKCRFNVNIIDTVKNDIDLIIYSNFNDENRSIKGIKKLYYSGENDFPDYNRCDYAITHNIIDYNRHFRLPLWCLYMNDNFSNIPNIDIDCTKREFCSSVISNYNNSINERLSLVDEISRYKKVSNGGLYKNNVGGPVTNKHDFIRKFKFNIASENSIVSGYVTEKIFEAFCANTIPIYLGDDYIKKDFNQKSFINVKDFNSYDDLVNRIKLIDTNDDLYLDIINTNRFNDNDYYNNIIYELEEYLFGVVLGSNYEHTYGKIGLLQ